MDSLIIHRPTKKKSITVQERKKSIFPPSILKRGKKETKVDVSHNGEGALAFCYGTQAGRKKKCL